MDPYNDVLPDGGILSQKSSTVNGVTKHMGDVMHVFAAGFTLFHWPTDGGSDVQRSEEQHLQKQERRQRAREH